MILKYTLINLSDFSKLVIVFLQRENVYFFSRNGSDVIDARTFLLASIQPSALNKTFCIFSQKNKSVEEK